MVLFSGEIVLKKGW